MKLRDITDAIMDANLPVMRRGFCALIEFPKGEVVEAASGGLLIVALNRLCGALAGDLEPMPAEVCHALGLAPGEVYATGAVMAKREWTRISRDLVDSS